MSYPQLEVLSIHEERYLNHSIPLYLTKEDDGEETAAIAIAPFYNLFGLKEQTVRQIISDPLFAPYRRTMKVKLPGRKQPRIYTALTKKGALALLYRLKSSHAGSVEQQKALLEFQRWATDVLADAMDALVAHQQPLPRDFSDEQYDRLYNRIRKLEGENSVLRRTYASVLPFVRRFFAEQEVMLATLDHYPILPEGEL